MKVSSRWRRAAGRGWTGLLVATALVWGMHAPRAQAQEPPPEDPPAPAASGGEPWQGYAAFGFVAVLAVFIICKSARRS